MKCKNTSVTKFCTKDMDCYVNSPQHFNCFCVWQYFNKETQLTLEEIGALLNLSYERIRQIEQIALKKYAENLKHIK